MCNVENHQSSRYIAIDLLKKSIPLTIWNESKENLDHLKEEILAHPLFKHSIIEKLNNANYSLEKIQDIHLEYQHSIVEIFTDALLMAQFQAKQLDPKIFPTIKMYPRFLIAFNINDEFGLSSENNSYQNTPLNAHFCLFHRVLHDLKISKNKIDDYKCSSESNNVRLFLESTYSDYIKIVLALAIAEQQVITFSPPLKEAVKGLNIPTNEGYYDVHGTTDDTSISAADDLHEEDLWLLLNHSLHLTNFSEIRETALKYCDLWYEFWNKMENI
ncbi:hypothetical protein [Acinetobacter nectaris]|uniref:hypothetical protein n=1 Tax=Acinetobacter nectaris TaxID=1219382 RepID=UPI001F1AF351|nr:hypothetical protein [Acinetobacter nectaris]MCF9033685.1 hypothetical protein [Acinetobacter nectaris]